MMIALDNENKKYLFLSGILLGCAILIKQHAIFFSLFGLTYIVYFKKQAGTFIDVFSKTRFFLIGVLTPLILLILTYFLMEILLFFFIAPSDINCPRKTRSRGGNGAVQKTRGSFEKSVSKC